MEELLINKLFIINWRKCPLVYLHDIPSTQYSKYCWCYELDLSTSI